MGASLEIMQRAPLVSLPLRAALAATLAGLLSTAACSDDGTSNAGGQPEGGGGSAEGGAGGGEAADPLGLADCPGEATTLGDPLALPAIDWTSDDGAVEATCALRALDAVVEPTKIICLGENAHGVSESSRWHAIVARYLVHRFHVRVIAYEAPGASSDAWGRYVTGGDAEELENGFADSKSSLGDSIEQEHLINAFRDVQLELPEGDALRVTGFDVAVQDKATRASLVAYLEAANPAGAEAQVSALGSGDYLERAEAADEIAAAVEADAGAYAELTSEAATKAALRDALNLADGYRFLDRYTEGDFWDGNKRFREPGMIRNIGTLLSELAEGERMVLISHNGHCGRDMSSSGDPSEAATWPAFGTHFASELGADYYVLGQVYGSGKQLTINGTEQLIHSPDGSLEALLNDTITTPASAFATSTSAFDLGQSYDMENMAAVVPAEQFDAMIYVRDVTPITLR